jgi:hypothetical protein
LLARAPHSPRVAGRTSVHNTSTARRSCACCPGSGLLDGAPRRGAAVRSVRSQRPDLRGVHRHSPPAHQSAARGTGSRPTRRRAPLAAPGACGADKTGHTSNSRQRLGRFSAGSQRPGAETVSKENRAGEEARRVERSACPEALGTGDGRPDPGRPTKEERACRRSIWTPR